MKKRVLFLLCILSLLLLTACAGAGDWTSEPLSGGYRVVRASAHVVQLCDESGAVVIPDEIIRICFGERFIGAERKPSDTDTQTEYYLVSVESGTVLGPYGAQEYDAACAEMGVNGLCDWMRPNDLPRVR